MKNERYPEININAKSKILSKLINSFLKTIEQLVTMLLISAVANILWDKVLSTKFGISFNFTEIFAIFFLFFLIKNLPSTIKFTIKKEQ